jgi:hypothetical protein
VSARDTARTHLPGLLRATWFPTFVGGKSLSERCGVDHVVAAIFQAEQSVGAHQPAPPAGPRRPCAPSVGGWDLSSRCPPGCSRHMRISASRACASSGGGFGFDCSAGSKSVRGCKPRGKYGAKGVRGTGRRNSFGDSRASQATLSRTWCPSEVGAGFGRLVGEGKMTRDPYAWHHCVVHRTWLRVKPAGHRVAPGCGE